MKSLPTTKTLGEVLHNVGSAILEKTLSGKVAILEDTDPEHIYVETVSAFFNMPHRLARTCCELAVKHGQFKKRVGFLCPTHGNIIYELDATVALPEFVTCDVCEATGQEVFRYKTQDLKRLEFFSLVSNG